MGIINWVARTTDARKALPVGAGKASTDFFNGNEYPNTAQSTRLQFLIASCGLSAPRANLLAALVWGNGS